MSIASEVRRVSREAGVPVAEMLYASGGEGLFRVGILCYCGYGFGSRFTTIRISTGGERMVGVFLGKKIRFPRVNSLPSTVLCHR